MSRGVGRVVAGIGMAPSLMQPRITSYHSGTRGSITNTRSPLATPSPARNRAARSEEAARSAKLNRRGAPPARPPARRGGLWGSAARPGADPVAGVVVDLGHLEPERRPGGQVVGHVRRQVTHGKPPRSELRRPD